MNNVASNQKFLLTKDEYLACLKIVRAYKSYKFRRDLDFCIKYKKYERIQKEIENMECDEVELSEIDIMKIINESLKFANKAI